MKPSEAFNILSEYETTRHDFLVGRVGEDVVGRVIGHGLTDKVPRDYQDADMEFIYKSAELFGRVDEYGLVGVNSASLLAHRSERMPSLSLQIWLKATPRPGGIDLQKTHQLVPGIDRFRPTVPTIERDEKAAPKFFEQLRFVTKRIR